MMRTRNDVQNPERLLHAVSLADLLARLPLSRGSIRIKIVVFCIAMSAIAAAFGSFSLVANRGSATLVARTFDESLMSINFARAAAADFAAMRAVAARDAARRADAAETAEHDEMAELANSLAEDLGVASERSQSHRARTAATRVKQAADAWLELRRRALAAPARSDDDLEIAFDQAAITVDRQIELLVNYTAGDAFLFRQRALADIRRDRNLTIAGLVAALVLSALFSVLLARQLIGPVAIASRLARSIADGNLDTPVPRAGRDELGILLGAMEAMRNNIKKMMLREIALRRSAQARLSDALEHSREGVVLLDSAGAIALANSRAVEFLGAAPDLMGGEARSGGESISGVQSAISQTPLQPEHPDEALLADGRWLRISRSHAQEGGVIIVMSDITALKRQEADLQSSKDCLDAALAHMSQGLLLYDSNGRLRVINRRFCEIFSVDPGSISPGMTDVEVIHALLAMGRLGECGYEQMRDERDRCLTSSGPRHHFIDLADGRIVSLTHRSVADGGWLTTCEDVTAQQQAASQIAFMARHDVLTGLPNRAMLAERIEMALAHAGRGTGFALFCLDLDKFKLVNDTLGHPVGDELLCSVAMRLSACVRETDTVARLGGDEFAIVQSGVLAAADCEPLARRVVEALSRPFDLAGHRVCIGCSIGISLAPDDGTSLERLMKNADIALYRAKASGRGTWRFFESEMDEELQRRRSLQLDMREAIGTGQFYLVYQPLYDLHLDRVCGFEALLRWNHPQRGMVSPTEFIPIAEEAGLIGRIGEWVVERACLDAARWPDGLKVAVNASVAQFKGASFAHTVEQALARSGLKPQNLEIEITESVLLSNSSEAIAALDALRATGVQIALDDFGTGYSSLSYLSRIPVDKIKIDRSFMSEVTSASGTVLIVRAIIGLGRSLGMRVIAEGIETTAQLELMRMEGCDEIQGYLVSRPVAASEVAVLLARHCGRLDVEDDPAPEARQDPHALLND